MPRVTLHKVLLFCLAIRISSLRLIQSPWSPELAETASFSSQENSACSDLFSGLPFPDNGGRPVFNKVVKHLPTILLLGDSVDRMVVDDFCISKHKNECSLHAWAKRKFKYKKGVSASAWASSSNGILGFLHVYGSGEHGPYPHGHINTFYDPYTDTPLRICKGIQYFTEEVATPTHIVFQVALWDIFLLQEGNCNHTEKHDQKSKTMTTKSVGHCAYREDLMTYKTNMLNRINDIKRCAPADTEVILRTTPWEEWAGDALTEFNKVIRSISEEQKLRLFDFDQLAYQNLLGGEIGFRDSIHPQSKNTAAFGNYMFQQLQR